MFLFLLFWYLNKIEQVNQKELEKSLSLMNPSPAPTHTHARTHTVSRCSTWAVTHPLPQWPLSGPCHFCGTGLSHHPHTLLSPFVYFFVGVTSAPGVCALSYIPHLNLWSGQSCLFNYHLYFLTGVLSFFFFLSKKLIELQGDIFF